MENKMYAVSVIYNNANGVEALGVFKSKDNVNACIMKWIEETEYDNYSICVTCTEFERAGILIKHGGEN